MAILNNNRTVQFLWLVMTIVLQVACDDLVGDVGLQTGGEIKIMGRLAGEHFGSSVDFVGDLNGDGLQDIAIGAPGNVNGGVAAGAVYVFLSPFDENSSGIEIRGNAGEGLGSSVIGAGDLDADGRDDLVISAPNSQPARVYIFRGTADTGIRTSITGETPRIASVDADLVIQSASTLGNLTVKGFAATLSAAGDFNRDGKLDLAIGAPDSLTAGGVNQGVVFIFYGGQSLSILGGANQGLLTSNSAELKLLGEANSDFGAALSYGGDPNGDFGAATSGVSRFGDDILIGAPSLSAAYLAMGVDGIGGSIDVLSYPRQEKLVLAGVEQFGLSVAPIGDLNNDAIDDFAVGFLGGVEIYQGFLSVGTLAGFQFEIRSDLADEEFATAIAGGRGQLLGGTAGLLVGAPGGNLNGENAGSAYFFSGSALSGFFQIQTTLGAAATATARFQGLQHAPIPTRKLGNSVRYGGDINADGVADAILGMPLYNGTGAESGAILVEF